MLRPLLVLCLVACWSSLAHADEEPAASPSWNSRTKGGRLNVLPEGRSMPHERPHLGHGVIPSVRYFDWKVRMAQEHELDDEEQTLAHVPCTEVVT